MDSLFASISDQSLGFWTGTLIFIITLFLVSRQAIGFSITLLLLIFSLVVGLSIANQDIIRNYFIGSHTPPKEEAKTTEKIQQQMTKAYNSMKAEFEEQIQKLQDSIKDLKDKRKKDDSTSTKDKDNGS